MKKHILVILITLMAGALYGGDNTNYQAERDRLVRLISAWQEHFYDVEFSADPEELEAIWLKINSLEEELKNLGPFIETLKCSDTVLLN